MDDPDISQEAEHRIQVASQGSRIRDGKPDHSPHREVLGHGRQCGSPSSFKLLQTWSPYPRPELANANQVPADLHSNGTARHTDRSHAAAGERKLAS
jgi:hypothetical protein